MPMDYRQFARIKGVLKHDPEGTLEAEHKWPEVRIVELSKVSNIKKVDKILKDIECGLKLSRANHRVLDQMSTKYEIEDEND
jgi:hypothetical protein